MKKTLEIIAGVIMLLVLAVTILTMPWPVSVVMGIMLFISFLTIIIYEQRRKKKEKEEEQAEGVKDRDEWGSFS